jgi:hypothetical protein
MKAEEAAELIGVSSGFLRRLAREGYVTRPYTAATVQEGFSRYTEDKEARAVAREEARGDDIDIAIERERLRLADLRHQLASHRRAKLSHVAEAWAWVFGELRGDLSAIWSKACDRIADRGEWCRARDHIEDRLNPLNIIFNAVAMSAPFRAPAAVVDEYGAPDPDWPLKKQKQWARLRDLSFRRARIEAATADVDETIAALDKKCRRFRSMLRQFTEKLADFLNTCYRARTTNEVVSEAVEWAIERVEGRKVETIKALREGRDPGDLDYDL